jgi:hypothetical protein
MTHTPSQNHVIHHEESDVDIAAIFKIGTGLIILAAVICVVVWLLFGYFDGREAANVTILHPLAAGQGLRLPPPPRLQITPRQDLRDLRAREDEVLNSYRWVDRSAGIVRIPIAEAMKLTVERGLPVRQLPEPGKQ